VGLNKVPGGELAQLERRNDVGGSTSTSPQTPLSSGLEILPVLRFMTVSELFRAERVQHFKWQAENALLASINTGCTHSHKML
jgi:hypothetical protein